MPNNRFHLYLLCLLILLISMSPASERLIAQTTPPTPADLIFSTGPTTANGLPKVHNILASLDIRTGQANRFYSDESAVYLKALSWSPDGKLLAFMRVVYDGSHYSAQLCLLNRAGTVQGCFDDAPVGYLPGYNTNGITWSPNSDRLYFISGDVKTRRLLEADVITHKTLRTLYEYPLGDNQSDNPPVLAWTADLGYLTVGAGDNTRVQQGLPVLLVNLNTRQTVDLAHIPGTTGASLFVVCPYFSPRGTYLTAYNFDVPETPSQPEFLILNTLGAIVSTIKPVAPLNALPMSCPTWQADESAFYFPLSHGNQQSGTLQILKYALDSRQFTLTFDAGPLHDLAEAIVISPLALSPDEQSIVFDSPVAPAANIGTQVTVIALAHNPPTLQRYSAPFDFSSDALWSPLLQSPF